MLFFDLFKLLGRRFTSLDASARSFIIILGLVFSLGAFNIGQVSNVNFDGKVLGGEVVEAVAAPAQPDNSFLNLESALAAAKTVPDTDLEEGNFNDELYFMSGGDSLLPNSNSIVPTPASPLPSAPKTFQPRPRPFWTIGPDLAGSFLFPTVGFNRRIAHYYNAVDISANSNCLEENIPVYASASGLVVSAFTTQSTSRYVNGGYGNNVLILHPNGVLTRYAHLRDVLVKGNSYVAQGSLIAYMGGYPHYPGSGNSTGCHLHFEVRGAKNPFIPASFYQN